MPAGSFPLPDISGTGVMICGHGSRDDQACVEFVRVVDAIAARLPEHPVAMGYLEFARPIIREGLDRLRSQGVDRVLAMSGMPQAWTSRRTRPWSEAGKRPSATSARISAKERA